MLGLWRGRPRATSLPQTPPTPGFLVNPVTGEGVTGVKESDGDTVSKPNLVGRCPGVEVEVNGKTIQCLLDTGSQVTLFSESLFKTRLQDLAVNTIDKPSWLTLKAANGLQIPYIGYAILDFKVGGVHIPNKGAIIVNDECLGSDRAVLGMNVITECWKELMEGVHPGVVAFRASVAPEAGSLWEKAFAVCRQVQQRAPTSLDSGVVKLTRQPSVIIPPQTEMMLWCQVSNGTPKSNCAMLIEPLTEEEFSWRAAHTLAEVQDGRVPVRICNPNPFPVEVPQRRPLATATPVGPEDIAGHRDLVLTPGSPGVVEVGVSTVQASPPAITSLMEDQGMALTPDQRQRLHQLLQKWEDIFAQHDEDFGRTSAVKHQIPTGTAPPSRERYRPVPPTLYAELKSLLKNMLEGGVIRESSSPWAAPIVLVKKKDGSWRFCADYRKLNAVTHKDAYPLPRIEESLTSLKGAQWYSTLDLASGYWQVEVDERDREKTAFATPMGLYEFERMPFGLCNAPATFQRLMQRCLGEFLNESLLIYLDDVVVYSSSFDQHLQDLDQVFQRLHSHGLKLQPRKCKLFQSQVSYLGHVVSSEGVATDPGKIAVIQSWAAPQNVRQVRSFLGLVGYYRRYIPGFAKIAAPLHGLLQGTATASKTAPIKWTPACEQAFQTLKAALTSPPILAYADFQLPFRLYTDASLDGLGAVLAQVQDGKERVIAYASRSLHPAEKNDQNYSSFKLELLALKWAMTEKFKEYLWGMEVEVFTDNNPLVHLQTAKLGAVEQRWAAQMANFSYTIRYRPGASNRNADVLSRIQGERVDAATRVVEAEPGETETTSGPPHWHSIQKDDPDLAQLMSWKEKGGAPSPAQATQTSLDLQQLLKDWDKISLTQRVLRREDRTGLDVEPCSQILVPKTSAKALWQEYHERGGHPSAERTFAILQRRYFWSGMRRDSAAWADACPHCILYKAGPEARAPLVPIETSYPFQMVGIDFLSLGRPGDTYPYLLVMTDLFSKFAIVVPTKDQTAATTAKAVWESLFQVYGSPEHILSDRGAAFESELFQQLCSLYGCRKKRTTAYHPQGNGACERFNQTLLKLLGTLAEETHMHWPSRLPSLIQAYNNTPHSTTGLTPYYVVFGRHARLPIDWIHEAGPSTDQQTLNGWVRSHHQVLCQTWQAVQQHTQQRQQGDKSRRDRRAHATELQVGERVLLRHFRRRAFGKLAPRWQRTPYVVVSRLRPGHPVYLIRPEGEEGPVRTAHRNNLRVCPLSFPQDDRDDQGPAAVAPNQAQAGEQWDNIGYRPLVFWRRPLDPEGTGPTTQAPAALAQPSSIPAPAPQASNSTQDARPSQTPREETQEAPDVTEEPAEAPEPRRSQRSTQGLRPLRYQADT